MKGDKGNLYRNMSNLSGNNSKNGYLEESNVHLCVLQGSFDITSIPRFPIVISKSSEDTLFLGVHSVSEKFVYLIDKADVKDEYLIEKDTFDINDVKHFPVLIQDIGVANNLVVLELKQEFWNTWVEKKVL